jgi:hypothetical protein
MGDCEMRAINAPGRPTGHHPLTSSTSQKNSFPRREQNHWIQLGSSWLPLMSSLSSLSLSETRSTASALPAPRTGTRQPFSPAPAGAFAPAPRAAMGAGDDEPA